MVIQHSNTQLFLVRLWTDVDDDGRPVWRGKLQHVVSGEAHYFQEWPALIARLQAALPAGTLSSSVEEARE